MGLRVLFLANRYSIFNTKLSSDIVNLFSSFAHAILENNATEAIFEVIEKNIEFVEIISKILLKGFLALPNSSNSLENCFFWEFIRSNKEYLQFFFLIY